MDLKLDNLDLKPIDEKKEEPFSLEQVLGKIWICPQMEDGLHIVELENATDDQFHTWLAQVWPPLIVVLKKSKVDKKDRVSFFNHVTKMHKLMKFPKNSLGD